jgi:hypothetical protein
VEITCQIKDVQQDRHGRETIPALQSYWCSDEWQYTGFAVIWVRKSEMKISILSALVGVFAATQLVADPISYKEARKILPKANGKFDLVSYPDAVPEKDLATLAAAKMKSKDVFNAIGASLEGYGAVAISPDEGLLVEWISGVSQHHSLDAARAAAIDYCNGKKKAESADCEIIVEISPKGAKEGALTLSASAIAAVRGAYRKLDKPRAFAISPSTGDFGMDRGDGGRALDNCASAANKAKDCIVVIAD